MHGCTAVFRTLEARPSMQCENLLARPKSAGRCMEECLDKFGGFDARIVDSWMKLLSVISPVHTFCLLACSFVRMYLHVHAIPASECEFLATQAIDYSSNQIDFGVQIHQCSCLTACNMLTAGIDGKHIQPAHFADITMTQGVTNSNVATFRTGRF